MSPFNQSSIGGAGFGAPSTTPSAMRRPLTAANLAAATSGAATSQAPSRMDSGEGRRQTANGFGGFDADTLRSVPQSEESADCEISRSGLQFNPAPRFNATDATVGAGSLFAPGPTNGMTFAQLADYYRTRVGGNGVRAEDAITAQQQFHQRNQLASALCPITGDPYEASALAARLQSHFQGSIAQSALQQFGARTGIPRSIIQPVPVSVTVTFVATPELARLIQQSMYGPSAQSQNPFAQSNAGPEVRRVHTLTNSDGSCGETIYTAGPRFQAGDQGEPAHSRFKDAMTGFKNGFRNKFKRSPRAASTAESRDAPPRGIDSELQRQFSRFLSSQNGIPSQAPRGQFTLADLAPVNRSAAPPGVDGWLDTQIPQPQGGSTCAQEYYRPQGTTRGSMYQPQQSLVS